MAASSSDPGASIVALANVGDALSKSMNKFLDEWPTRRGRFWELDAETHPVKIMLMHLAESVNRYGNDVGFDENTVKPVLDVVKIAFEKVAKALEKAGVGKGEKGEKVVENGDGGKAKEQEGDDKDKSAKWVWVADDAFAEAIGGTKGIDRIVKLLKIEKGILVSLNRAVRYMAFRKLEKEKNITPEQEKDLKCLVGQTDEMLMEFDQTKRHIGKLSEMLKKGEDPLEVLGDRKVEPEDDREREWIRPRQRVVDDDARSFSSVCSDPADDFVEAKEVYEEWTIRQLPGSDRPRRRFTWLFLTVKEIWDDTLFHVEAMPQSQEALKAKYGEESAKLTAKRDMSVERAMRSMPARARLELHYLVNDRERYTINRHFIRKWKILDIVPSVSKGTPVGWGMWQDPTEWQVVIKAETLEDKSQKVPERLADPFRKSRRNELDIRVNRQRGGGRVIRPERDYSLDRRPVYVEQGARQQGVAIFEPTSPEEAEQKIQAIFGEIGVAGKDCDEDLVTL